MVVIAFASCWWWWLLLLLRSRKTCVDTFRSQMVYRGKARISGSDTVDDAHVITDSVPVNCGEDCAARIAQTISSGEQQIHVLRTHTFIQFLGADVHLAHDFAASLPTNDNTVYQA